MSIDAELDRFAATVEGHLRWILDVAKKAPPGGNFEWDAAMAHYGASPSPAEERFREAAETELPKGAVASEVARTIGAMAAQARGELDRIGAAHGGGARLDAMRGWLDGLGAAVSADYLAKQKIPPTGSMSSIFKNARAHAGERWWEKLGEDYTRSHVVVCKTCGAPQQQRLEFTCIYCGNEVMVRGGAT